MGAPEMDLSYEEIGLFSPWRREARDLYARAFPEVERLPFGMLLLSGLRPFAHFEACVLDGALAAITYSVETDEGIYLLYLAVSDEMRGRGVGSAVLAEMRRRAGDGVLALDVEPPYEGAPNAEQRRRRMAFYRRAGVTSTGRCLVEDEATYLILSTHPEVSDERLRRLVGSLLPGYDPRVEGARELGVPEGDEA